MNPLDQRNLEKQKLFSSRGDKQSKEGEQPEIRRITNHAFKELADDYIKWAERQRSFRQKKLVVNQLVERFGQYSLRRFDARLLEGYQSERLEKGYKAATINRHLALLKHMFTKAGEWEFVEEESVKRVHKLKQLEEINARLRYLTKEECQLLIGSCDKHLKPIVITSLNTGVRKGEILSLKWDNLDLRKGFIFIGSHEERGKT